MSISTLFNRKSADKDSGKQSVNVGGVDFDLQTDKETSDDEDTTMGKFFFAWMMTVSKRITNNMSLFFLKVGRMKRVISMQATLKMMTVISRKSRSQRNWISQMVHRNQKRVEYLGSGKVVG